MFVIARKLNESVTIDDGKIVVKVLSIEKGIVRIGFDAPDEVIIKRTENMERLKHDKT